jgi:hypothetical protein
MRNVLGEVVAKIKTCFKFNDSYPKNRDANETKTTGA